MTSPEVKRCPTCGQALSPPGPNRTRELMDLLATRAPEAPGHVRHAYRIGESRDWAITYGRSLPAHQFFRDTDIKALVRKGDLVPVYPGMAGERDAYGPAHYYGSAGYLRDLEFKVARRTRSTQEKGG